MIYEKLLNIQKDLKAPKGQYNSFGKYKYRSCEDILEAVKPLLAREKVTLLISDEVVEIGGRVYIKATARLYDMEGSEGIENTALARESSDKKGMDESQITGTASSYARKYCLNGLFLIDDTKDADTDEYRNQQKKADDEAENKKMVEKADTKLSTTQVTAMIARLENNNVDIPGLLKMYGLSCIEDMTVSQMADINLKLEASKKEGKK